ncbi:MAG: 1,4-dihydroxy-6-naphthoate synthase [Bacteroidales bacterium]|nr:1,4-dihydroxy-6-naphthoate synthase [Bacteroidales bacterium]
MKISLGFSTCPNDTFIFDALINGKIDADGFEFIPVLADVEELNKKALSVDLDVTKLSYHAYGHVAMNYKVLDSGSALGHGNGPLVVSKKKIPPAEITEARIAIPGNLTTANFLMSIAFSQALNKKSYLFSDIESVVLSNEADIGVLIHENRFTYAERGLILIEDLGAFWERKTNLPIPLGGIMVSRLLSESVQIRIQKCIHDSIMFAFDNPESSIDYMRKYAQEMREDILHKHVQTFVNDFSLSLGTKGRKAVRKLFDLGSSQGLFPKPDKEIFVPFVNY